MKNLKVYILTFLSLVIIYACDDSLGVDPDYKSTLVPKDTIIDSILVDDSVWVYDTTFVYDTVYQETIIYDTIIELDTIYEDDDSLVVIIDSLIIATDSLGNVIDSLQQEIRDTNTTVDGPLVLLNNPNIYGSGEVRKRDSIWVVNDSGNFELRIKLQDTTTFFGPIFNNSSAISIEIDTNEVYPILSFNSFIVNDTTQIKLWPFIDVHLFTNVVDFSGMNILERRNLDYSSTGSERHSNRYVSEEIRILNTQDFNSNCVVYCEKFKFDDLKIVGFEIIIELDIIVSNVSVPYRTRNLFYKIHIPVDY